MSHRYYVVVGIDVPGHFTSGAAPEKEEQAAARLVQSLLSDALTDRDVHAAVTGVITLSPETIDLIVLALREDAAKREAGWKVQKEVLDKKLAELREAIDRSITQRKDAP